MTREIKFRGFDECANKWRYGYLAKIDNYYAITKLMGYQKVEELSIGQYTGLKDKNGKEIYDGDIIHYKNHGGYLLNSFVGEIVWIDDYACFGYSTLGYDYDFADIDELESDFLRYVEVIGNVYENLELLYN